MITLSDLRQSMRYYSMRLGVLASAVLGFAVANPDTLVGVFGGLPEPLRIPFAIVTAVGAFTCIAIARLMPQPGVKPDGE